MFNLEHK